MKQSIPFVAANSSQAPSLTIGLDLGDRDSHYCVFDEGCQRQDQGRVATTREALTKFLETYRGARIVLEVGGHSPWVSRLAAEAGLEVIVANARRVELIGRNDRKNDRTDAELLARLGRLDPQLLSPVRHRSSQYQADLSVLRARRIAVETRTGLINHVRGASKSFGKRLPSCSPACFHERALKQIPAELEPGLLAILRLIGQINAEIESLDEVIEGMADQRYPVTQVLRQVPGVGPVVALSYVLTLEDPDRVANSRQAGPYLGLVPRRCDSGDSSPQLRITKAGDGEVRRLLVISANYILGHFGPDCDLRRFGLQIAARGGKNARKRAKTAVARKLAVLLHHLWKTGQVYDPFHLATRRGECLAV